MSNIKIVTYNFRNDWYGSTDGINGGIYRFGTVLEKIDNEKPDVICFQEIREPSKNALVKALTDYIIVGQLRNKDYTGEGIYTAIRKDTMDLLGLDIFWIGPEPYVPESRFESQSVCPRICVMTMIRHKISGERMRVYNVHLDHIGEIARVEGIKCVLNMAVADRKKMDLPVVVLGDFNARPESETVEYCNNFKEISLFEATKDIKSTFHAFGKKTEDCKIDYIFVSDELKGKVKSVCAWKDVENGIYLSDHYPIVTELEV